MQRQRRINVCTMLSRHHVPAGLSYRTSLELPNEGSVIPFYIFTLCKKRIYGLSEKYYLQTVQVFKDSAQYDA